MKALKKILILLILLMPFTFFNNVSADTSILDVDNIKQVQNQYNVKFNIINNYEVGATYEDLGDTLEFDVVIKNKSAKYNVRIKNLTILTDSEGVDYTAAMDSDNLELQPNETRTIRIKGVLNDKAFDSEKIIKFQIHYSISERPCPDCNKPIPVIVNPTTGDTINYSFIILAGSIIGILLIITIILIRKRKSKSLMSLLLMISMGIYLFPLINVKADTDYVLEIILHQKILINKLDDTIRVTEIITPYTGAPIDGDFDNDSDSPITPIYYDDELCQNPIEGKPVNAGTYYATATSEGNNWYKPATLECTKVIEINKIPSSCPMIEDVTANYDGQPHSLVIGDGIVGGDLYYSLDNINWTSEEIAISNAGVHTIYTKVVGDINHTDLSCGINTITINKKNLTIKAIDQTKVYDGTPLVADSTCEIVGDSSGKTVQCTASGSIENVGQADKIITGVIVTEDGVDVTNNYNIIPEIGKLIVTPNPIAVAGSCINPTYSSYEQNLIEGGLYVEYTTNTGTEAGEYSVTATASPNYSFEDGTTIKTVSCSILKREITITPNEQDIVYGTDISKTLSDVVTTNLVDGHALTEITLEKDSDEVTDNGKIIASNASVFNGDIDVTNNYEITYNKGKLKTYYLSTFESGPHCEMVPVSTKKSYNSNLKLSVINPSIGYSAKGWNRDGSFVGEQLETITIDGNYTYISECIDDIKPDINDLTVEPGVSDFTINVKAIDLGSGSTKVEWFYKKCGDALYQRLPDTVFEPTNEQINESASSNLCLSFGTYYAYVKVTDEAGNVRTSSPVRFDLNNPTTDKVNVNGSNVGTTCKSLECSLNELLEYFK